ncbi:hypothetical protein E2C01_045041 [Portunus trituberculatus]|uniref:Uncharacterized protein n=1 Tax=Portunus trituberculatus TaxID=210409 RepID=A0A5B7FTN9_PORTR|nr:hypothetical protein [Portunus trituberculatus]
MPVWCRYATGAQKPGSMKGLEHWGEFKGIVPTQRHTSVSRRVRSETTQKYRPECVTSRAFSPTQAFLLHAFFSSHCLLLEAIAELPDGSSF